ncbi:class I SAM-dependent methyltransferase [Microlunatus ginsengisoli]|uniref:Class I SAM-dependent methyltransferase n=1 Tax=Microlunatus ginsengisoli TaxID=363863 RepID=A0ABP7AD23_9ACTN
MTQLTTAPRTEIDADLLQELVGQAVGDFGAVLNASLVVIGDRLGLYRALADLGSSTSAELATATGTTERNVREWLSAQAAAGYVSYDGRSDGLDRWSLSPEQVEAFTNADSPAFVAGGFQVVTGAAKGDELVTEAFRTGRGLGWHEHHHDLFAGTERFFRPGYAASLVSEWLPALPGVPERLAEGGLVADVGCGYGASTVLMARAFPRSTFVGFDYHESSITAARSAAAAGGVVANTTFEVAPAGSFPGTGYDLVCFFDCLHDMGDPVGALRHTRAALAADGVVLLVEPRAGDTVADNLNPVGRLFYAASTLICTPASQSQPVGRALGAQAGVARLTGVAREAGFGRVREAASTPFNLVLELRP